MALDTDADVTVETNAAGDTAIFGTAYVGGKHYAMVRIIMGGSVDGLSSGSGAMDAGTARVATATDDPNFARLFSPTTPPTASFTPAATSHAGGDSVGGKATFSSVGAAGATLELRQATLSIASTDPATSSYRLHLFQETPGTDPADDAAVSSAIASAESANYQGYIDFDVPVDLGSTLQWRQTSTPLIVKLKAATTSLVGYLETRSTTAYNTIIGASAHKVTLFPVPLN